MPEVLGADLEEGVVDAADAAALANAVDGASQAPPAVELAAAFGEQRHIQQQQDEPALVARGAELVEGLAEDDFGAGEVAAPGQVRAPDMARPADAERVVELVGDLEGQQA